MSSCFDGVGEIFSIDFPFHSIGRVSMSEVWSKFKLTSNVLGSLNGFYSSIDFASAFLFLSLTIRVRAGFRLFKGMKFGRAST